MTSHDITWHHMFPVSEIPIGEGSHHIRLPAKSSEPWSSRCTVPADPGMEDTAAGSCILPGRGVCSAGWLGGWPWCALSVSCSLTQESVFQLSDSSVRTAVLSDLLQALESQLIAPPTRRTVAIATELSMLYMILLKKWTRFETTVSWIST